MRSVLWNVLLVLWSVLLSLCVAAEDNLRHKINMEIDNFRATMLHALSEEFFGLHCDNSHLQREHLVHPKSLEHFPEPDFSVRVCCDLCITVETFCGTLYSWECLYRTFQTVNHCFCSNLKMIAIWCLLMAAYKESLTPKVIFFTSKTTPQCCQKRECSRPVKCNFLFIFLSIVTLLLLQLWNEYYRTGTYIYKIFPQVNDALVSSSVLSVLEWAVQSLPSQTMIVLITKWTGVCWNCL